MTSTATKPRVLFTSLAMAAALFASSCGTSAVEATSGATTNEASTTAAASAGSVFDSTSIHSVDITFDDDAYAELLQTYVDSSEKEWIEATVTIDGTTYEQVGLRLKGNSSLRGVTTDAVPEELPWLIRFDKYIDDQNHEGTTDLVVRSNNTESALNEAVALTLLGDAGLATQQAIETSFVVNGSDAELRLIIEHPDDEWMNATFSDEGALYKAESTGDYTYRGEDEESYDEVFDQEAGKDNTDLSPLIDFLDFINNTDDETFASELSEHLDVEAFADYLAMMELLDNFDDIDGPGNNSYLYYDTGTERFTVVAWDLNLAFGVTNGAAGDQADGAVGGQAAGAAGGQEGGVPGDRPEPGAVPGDEGQGGAGQGGGRPQQTNAASEANPVGGPNGSNVLSERFLAIDDFVTLYEDSLARLDAELFASGHADEVIDSWSALLDSAPELIDAATLASEVESIRASAS